MIDLLTSYKTNPAQSNFIWKIIDVLYPPFCHNCGVIGYDLCPNCFDKIKIINTGNICDICGSIILNDNTCKNINIHSSYAFDQARSWGEYQGSLKGALKKIKYECGFGLIKYFVQPLADYINNWNITFDFISPVVLGKKRRESRGYNQAEILAKPVAEILSMPFIPNALARIRETSSQVGLNFEQRKENVKNAFKADRDICEMKSILLFDDITTTFSTLNECSKALKSAGAKKVYCFTIARTI